MYVNFYHMTLALVFATTIDYRFFAGISGIPSITLTEIIAYFMVMLYIGRALFYQPLLKEEFALQYRANRPLFWYFSWAIAAGFAGMAFRSSPEVLKVFKNLLPSFIVYYFVTLYCKDTIRVNGLIITYLTGIFVNILLGLSQYVSDWPRPVLLTEGASEKMDFAGNVISKMATGLFNHPNGLAMLLLPATILLVAMLVTEKDKSFIRSFLLSTYLILLIVVLKATYAKGVFVWTIIGSTLLFLPQRLARWRFAVGLFTLVAGIAGITYYSFHQAVTEGGAFGTILTRMMLWTTALEVIRTDNYIKVFGNGFKAMDIASAEMVNWQYPNAHNGILNQILFYGIPAFILYIIMYVKALKDIAGALIKTSDDTKTLCIFIYSALIALCGEYFFEPANDGVVLQSHLFLLYALIQVLSRLRAVVIYV